MYDNETQENIENAKHRAKEACGEARNKINELENFVDNAEPINIDKLREASHEIQEITEKATGFIDDYFDILRVLRENEG